MNYLTIKPLTPNEKEKFNSKYRIEPNGCWIWTAFINQYGYGRFRIGGKKFQAHRVSYAIAHNGLYARLVVDHLCRDKACVNPEHLELVTVRENTIRGDTPKIMKERFSKMVSCRRGHKYNKANTYYYKRHTNNGNTYIIRLCKKCKYKI